MMREDHLSDDTLQRVAATRPALDERELSPSGKRATRIAERVARAQRVADPLAPYVSTRRRARRVGRMSITGACAALGATVAATGVALVLAGTFTGPAGTGTEPAVASVMRQTADAMSGRGSIVVEKLRYSERGPHRSSFSQEIVTETPAGAGPEEVLNSGFTSGDVTGDAVIGGHEEVYSPATNTIYVSSIWGPYIHPGATPGTYVYRAGPGTPLNPTLGPFPLTAAQARDLRRGDDQLMVRGTTDRLRFAPVGRAPSLTQALVELLRENAFHLVGRTTINGRAAIEFSGPKWDPTAVGTRRDPHDIGGTKLYVDPRTHLPIKETIDRGATDITQTWAEYEVLPITPANQRLVTLQSLHPTATVDTRHADYLKAAGRLGVFTGF